MRNTVCICGTNTITRHLIDWEQDADFWFFNESPSGSDVQKEDGSYGWVHGHRVDGVFQMHVPEIWRNPKNITHPGHYEWLQQPHNFPIYMQEKYEDVPAAVRYPRDEITASLLGNFVTENADVIEYYTSSAAYAIALAIYQGYQMIRLYGVEANSDTEYLRQRAGMAFWIGIAIANGVKVIRMSRSLLLNEPLYGYTGEVTVARDELSAEVPSLEEEVEKNKAAMNADVRTAAECLNHMAASGNSQKEMEKFTAAFAQGQESVYLYGVSAGKLQEAKRYLDYVDASGIQKQHVDLAYVKLNEEAQRSQAEMFECQGRVSALLSVLVSVKGKSNVNQVYKRFLDALNDAQKVARNCGVYVGRAQINATLSAELTERIKAAGGEKALIALQDRLPA